MSPWLRFLFGLEKGEVPTEGDGYWEFSGLPDGVWLLLAVVIAVLTVSFIGLLYRREKNLTAPQQITLTTLRLAALALVILVLLNPRLITEIHFRRPGQTVVLLDSSLSMQHRDRFDEDQAHALAASTGLDLADAPTRFELVRSALERNRILERLEAANSVDVYAVADGLRKISAVDAIDSVQLSRLETALGDGLEKAVKDSDPELLAGIVLISDGRNNSGVQPVELIKSSLEWKSRPIHTVGVGMEALVKNYSVMELSAPDTVEKDFPFEIEAKVRLSGIHGQVQAILYRLSPDSRTRRRIDQRVLEPSQLFLETRLKFIDVAKEKGSYRYTLELPHHPTEEVTRDNRREVGVLSTVEKRRLLFVSGQPTTEYRFLRNFFLRDPGVQVSCWLTSADANVPQEGNVVIKKLPRTSREFEVYDAVILLDPDPETLSADFQAGLVDFVSEKGGGLVYVSGETHTHRVASSQNCSKLRKLFPVLLAKQAPERQPRIYDRPWRPRLTVEGFDHPLCRLMDDAKENDQLWSMLPPFYFAYPSRRLKPAANALVRGDGNEIVMALARVGRGESLYLASDDSWRWRASRRQFHERFWAGVVRYLAEGKKRIGTQDITVETDRDRYEEGGEVQILVHSRNSETSPTGRAYYELRVTPLGLPSEDVKEQTQPSDSDSAFGPWKVLAYPVPGKPNHYKGIFRAEEWGEFSVEFESEEMTTFKVERIAGELEDPSPDLDLLREIAKRTNGSFTPLENIGELPDRIPDASVTEVVGRRAATIWDSAVLMLLFAGFVIAEWVLRKLWNLN